MTRTFRYRLQPSRAQIATLTSWLALTRELYNAALQERRDAWQKQGVSISKYDQNGQLAVIREARPEFDVVPIIVMRGPLARADKAFQAFFRRCKTGEKPGYPRFKGASRWSTVEIDDLGKANPLVAGERRVKVPLLGKVKLKYHRPMEGRPRVMRIKLNTDGHWYVSITCDGVEAKLLPTTGKTVGVDLGVITFAATSDGKMFDNPRALRAARRALRHAHQRVSRRKKDSKRYWKAVRLFAKKHAHVANVRRENHILVAKDLVAKYDTIFVEDLDIQHLAKKWFAKPINDVAWGDFLRWLDVKAESAGRQVVKVDPRGTSDLCSGCGNVVPKTLAVRVHACLKCGLVLDRDINAAINIKALGMSAQGAASAMAGRRQSVKSTKATRRPGHARSLSQ